MASLEALEDQDLIPKKVQTFVADAKNLLKQPFSFYTFSVEINNENKLDIINRYYCRHLEQKLIDDHATLKAMRGEVDAVRRTIKGLRVTEEESNRKI